MQCGGAAFGKLNFYNVSKGPRAQGAIREAPSELLCNLLCDITFLTALQSREAKIEFEPIQLPVQHRILGIEPHADFGHGFILKDEQGAHESYLQFIIQLPVSRWH